MSSLSKRTPTRNMLLFSGRAHPTLAQEVADLLGISQSYISRLEKRIIKKLRREIMKQY